MAKEEEEGKGEQKSKDSPSTQPPNSKKRETGEGEIKKSTGDRGSRSRIMFFSDRQTVTAGTRVTTVFARPLLLLHSLLFCVGDYGHGQTNL